MESTSHYWNPCGIHTMLNDIKTHAKDSMGYGLRARARGRAPRSVDTAPSARDAQNRRSARARETAPSFFKIPEIHLNYSYARFSITSLTYLLRFRGIHCGVIFGVRVYPGPNAIRTGRSPARLARSARPCARAPHNGDEIAHFGTTCKCI